MSEIKTKQRSNSKSTASDSVKPAKSSTTPKPSTSNTPRTPKKKELGSLDSPGKNKNISLSSSATARSKKVKKSTASSLHAASGSKTKDIWAGFDADGDAEFTAEQIRDLKSKGMTKAQWLKRKKSKF